MGARVVYDTILSAIHNSTATRGWLIVVVYDTILPAIHNSTLKAYISKMVVYDTIFINNVKELWCNDDYSDCKYRGK